MGYKMQCLCLLLVLAASYSDITLLNCPAQFNVNEYNVTTDTAATSLGAFIYAGFESDAAKARVEGIVTTGNTQQQQQYQNELMVPYIIFGVVYFVFFVGIVLCCLFDRSCPPCECLRRDL
jgi:hypothetical protein